LFAGEHRAGEEDSLMEGALRRGQRPQTKSSEAPRFDPTASAGGRPGGPRGLEVRVFREI